jgi:hypothetical protein
VIRSSGAAAALLVVGMLSACASTTDGTPRGAPVSSPSRAAPRHLPSSTAAAPSTPSTSAPSTSSSSTTHPVPSAPLRTKTVTASDGTVYAIAVWAEQQSEDCAAHAYGQVAQYLATHPCSGIHQLLATTAINGRAVGFAQNSVGFKGAMNTSYRAAGDFTTLISQNGTGNMNDLLREGYRLPAGPDQVPSPDAFKALGQDAGVVVVDAWYLEGSTRDNAPLLVKMAEDIFLQI